MILIYSIILFLFGFSTLSANEPFRRFEYKYSFKGPHLVQGDGTIPFWEYSGDAIASDESIRITPSLRSKKGQIWTKNKFENQFWEIEASFRITGRGKVGADGLALWFTTEKGQSGPVFGNNDKWVGLAVILDSFDNDAKQNNPYIMAVVNDGTKSFDHQTDGSSQSLAGCMRDFRNKPFPVKIKIIYYNKALSVFLSSGMTPKSDEFDLCLRAENVELSASGYFGITAATGGLADDHDVISFLTHSLTSTDQIPLKDGKPVTDDEKQKYDKEFDEYQKKLQEARAEYRKEHPKSGDDEDADEDKWFESQDARQLKQIFEGQAAIDGSLRLFGKRIDEVVGRQERIISQLALLSQGGQGLPSQQGQPVAQMDTIKRNEVDHLIRSSGELSQSLKEIRSLVGPSRDNSQIDNIQSSIRELSQQLKEIRSEVIAGNNRSPNAQISSSPSCLTTTYFLFFVALHLAVFIGYVLYRSNRESQAKKFY